MQAQTKNRSPTYQKISPLKNSNRFSGSQTRLRPSRTTSKQNSGAFLLTNTESCLPVITLPPGLRPSRNKWIPPDLPIQPHTGPPPTQRRPASSLSFVRAPLRPAQPRISSGHNSSTRCSPLQKQIDVARFGNPDKHRGPVHAETACVLPLIRQGYDMSRSDLYIVRRHKAGSLALSRPCPGCMSLLRANAVRRVLFSVEGGLSEERS